MKEDIEWQIYKANDANRHKKIMTEFAATRADINAGKYSDEEADDLIEQMLDYVDKRIAIDKLIASMDSADFVNVLEKLTHDLLQIIERKSA